jgi:hypothetical protein
VTHKLFTQHVGCRGDGSCIAIGASRPHQQPTKRQFERALGRHDGRMAWDRILYSLDSGDPDVEQLRAGRYDHDLAGLQVALNNPDAERRIERLAISLAY